ncbi:MAG: hypothetical protein AAGF11_43730 [Myxococcota bacterium]
MSTSAAICHKVSVLTRDLACVQMPARGERTPASLLRGWEQAYQLWHECRTEALRSQGMHHDAAVLTSEGFVEQDELLCLVSDDMVRGLLTVRWFDLSLAANRAHRYFRRYPPELIEQLLAIGVHDLMTVGHLTVDPAWRKPRVGVGIAELLVSMSMLRLIESGAQLGLAMTRNNRKINEMTYRHGAVPLRRNHRAYGGHVDVVAWYPDRVCLSPQPGIADGARALWSRRMVGLAPGGPAEPQRRSTQTDAGIDYPCFSLCGSRW